MVVDGSVNVPVLYKLGKKVCNLVRINLFAAKQVIASTV